MLGFSYQLVNGEERSHCVICGEDLAKILFVCNKSVQAFNNKTSLANKPLEMFERKLLEMLRWLNLIKTAVTTSTKGLLTPFEILYLIAKNRKLHAIGERLLLPRVIKLFKIMHENYGQAFKAISLSNSTAAN
jgi:hypothetical protein